MSDSPKPPPTDRPQTFLTDADSWKDLSQKTENRPTPAGRARPAVSKIPPTKILPSNPPTSPAKTRIRGLRILIVDDDPIRVDALAMDLRSLGGIVAVGDHSLGGYRQAARFLPDAIVSDLVRPGETGFRFIQNLRRHPLLRWSSVMLIRWWEVTSDGEGQVLIDHVLDQLSELLAPIRIIEERIAAKRPLSDRVDMTGPAALLRLLSAADLSGELAVVDAWNSFKIVILDGGLLSAHRKGIDGESDEGLQAVLQLLLCDTGRWSFRRHEKDPKTPPVTPPAIETTLSEANGILSQLFGLGARHAQDLHAHITVRENFLRTAYETLPEAAIQVVRSISNGADLDHFRATLTAKRDIAEVERIIQTLFRCGAIRFSTDPEDNGRSEWAKEASKSAVSLLCALTEMAMNLTGSRGSRPPPPTRSPRAEEEKAKPRGAYHLQDVAPEPLVGAKHRPLKLALDDIDGAPSPQPVDEEPQVTATGTTADQVDLATNLLKRRKQPSLPQEEGEDTGTDKVLMESRALALDSYPKALKEQRQKDNKQMWIALALALILGGLLALGIALIASSGRELPAPASEIGQE